MSYGLTAKNANGYFVIDETYAQYEVIAEGSLTYSGSDYPGSSTKAVSFSYTNVVGAFSVIRNASGHYMAMWDANGSANGSVFNSGATGTLYYKVLAPIVTQSAVGYGLRVRNASNKLVFDSGKVYQGIGQMVTINFAITIQYGYKYALSPFIATLPYNANGYWIPTNSTGQYLGKYPDVDYYPMSTGSIAYTTTNSFVVWTWSETGLMGDAICVDTDSLTFDTRVMLFT